MLLFWQNPLIPEDKREAVVSHIVLVHQSVVEYSKKFLQRLRRSNYVTPKNYLDFINTYTKLLDDKDKFILAQVAPSSCSIPVVFVFQAVAMLQDFFWHFSF